MARVEAIIIVVMLGTCITPALSAFWNFPACYERCILICAISNALPVCATKCVKDCIKRQLPNQSPKSYKCTMKCTRSKCIGISTEDDPRAEEVNHCLDSCSTSCSASDLITTSSRRNGSKRAADVSQSHYEYQHSN